MKTLRAKRIPTRTAVTAALSSFLFAVMMFSNQAAVMTAGDTGGWGKFKESMTKFFYTGMGGDGMKGVGIVIVCVGILMAAISFVVHKMNPQSRMPGWITCLVIALIGSILVAGIEPILNIVYWVRDTIMGWFGYDQFKDKKF